MALAEIHLSPSHRGTASSLVIPAQAGIQFLLWPFLLPV